MATRHAHDPSEDERPLGELFSELTSQLQVLVQKEIELARLEVSEQVSRGAKGGAMLALTGVMGFVALILLAFAAAWGLTEIVPEGLAFLIVGVFFVVMAAVLGTQGKKRLAAVRPPKQTVQTLKQDVQVAKESLARGTR